MATALQLRRSVEQLASLAVADLDVIWREASTADLAKAALLDVLPGLTEAYGQAAATLAADWYDDLRDSRGVRRRFTAIPADLGTAGAEELARWGVAPLFRPVADFAAARVLIAGGLQRRIANGARQTVMTSSVADPSARGWSRVGAGECEFCQLLIGRGAVYSEATADFESHDHCRCAAVPEFT